MKEAPEIVDYAITKIEIDERSVEEKETPKNSIKQSETEDDHKIDRLFYQMCMFCVTLGVNFYSERGPKARLISLVVVTVNCCLNLYFICYLTYITTTKPFETERVATSISIGTWVLQAMLSTIFLAYWQSTNEPTKLLKLLYEANKGVGIHHYRKYISRILGGFYIVVAFCVSYYTILIISNLFDVNLGYSDRDITRLFGDRRLFIIIQLSSLYCKLCWVAALFIFALLIHAADYEFMYFNEQVQTIKCNNECATDDDLCDFLLKLMKIHNRLTECVKCLDEMFHIYAFVMLATNIPATIFSLFMVFRRPADAFSIELVFAWPLVIFCVYSFFALCKAPSELHSTIYSTKSAFCANTDVWFPYRAHVYHSALAFVAHLDQTNLGVSIWGFAVVSKPLVLTALSVMVTCLALFLQVGECNASYGAAITLLTNGD